MMTMSLIKPQLKLSAKFRHFMRTKASVEFLEGTTAAGKTTVGIPKFMLRVADSNRRVHLICAKTIGVLEKNILNGELGLLTQFEGVAVYNPRGAGDTRLPHILYQTPRGEKVIYLAGYSDKSKWTDVLGGQYGCVLIDEINIADMEFVREIFHRREYLMATLNPDDPSLPIYSEYINHSRPLKCYVKDYPKELLSQLDESRKTGWIHWYFTFYDNAALTPEQIRLKIDAVPVGTKMYKNKIQGLRGRATGLVFSNFDERRHVINWTQAKQLKYVQFSVGVDTSYSSQSPDTLAFIFQGMTDTGKLVILDEEVYNNKDLSEPLAPSDIVPRLFTFADRNAHEWGMPECIFIDSADQATITEADKYLMTHPKVYSIAGSWKKMKIVDRLHLQLAWFATDSYLVLQHCTHHIHELNIYSWKEDKYEPEDGNDHTINASQYGFLPYRDMIGTGGNTDDD